MRMQGVEKQRCGWLPSTAAGGPGRHVHFSPANHFEMATHTQHTVAAGAESLSITAPRAKHMQAAGLVVMGLGAHPMPNALVRY